MRFPAPLLTCLACATLVVAQPAWAVATASANATALITQRVSIGVSQNIVLGVTTLPLGAIAPVSTATLGAISTESAVVVPGRTIFGGLSALRGGALTGSVGAIAQQIGGGTTQQASFVIIGDGNRSVSIAVPASVELSRLGGNGEMVEFTPITTLSSSGQSRLVAGADGNGSLAFGVGGQVNPDGDTAAGDYAGVLRITVQYN